MRPRAGPTWPKCRYGDRPLVPVLLGPVPSRRVPVEPLAGRTRSGARGPPGGRRASRAPAATDRSSGRSCSSSRTSGSTRARPRGARHGARHFGRADGRRQRSRWRRTRGRIVPADHCSFSSSAPGTTTSASTVQNGMRSAAATCAAPALRLAQRVLVADEQRRAHLAAEAGHLVALPDPQDEPRAPRRQRVRAVPPGPRA